MQKLTNTSIEGEEMEAEHNQQRTGTAGPGLVIRVSSGVGEGRTQLAAFDAALRSAGVENFNLIRLSSVIPPGSDVLTCAPGAQLRGGFGDPLYCVYAAGWATKPGSQAWAGVGWSRHDDGSGAGLFVEHTGVSQEEVRRRLAETLDDMAAGRGGRFAYDDEVLSNISCTGRPACAVVVASYRTVGWDQL